MIQELAKLLAPKYVFGYYTKEDIEEEAIIIGYDGFKRWDKNRPLRNFLYVHISNRLKTLKRDKYFRLNAGKAEDIQQRKKNIMQAKPLDDIDPPNDYEVVDGLILKEIKDEINQKLPIKYRQDYLRLCSGVKISKQKKVKLYSELKKILEKYNEDGSSDNG